MRRILLILVVALVVILALASVRLVGRGSVCLVGDGPETRRLSPGLNLVRPFESVRRYDLAPVYAFSGPERLVVPLASGMRATLDCTIQARLDQGKVTALDRQYGEAVAEKLLRPLLVRELSRTLSVARGSGEPDVAAAGVAIAQSLSAATTPMGLEIRSVDLANLVLESALPRDLARVGGLKVFILGLDGYDWKIADLVSETARLGNIERMRREGAWGNLRSIEPLISPLLWTTIATGTTPDVHGITDFLARDERTGEEVAVTSAMRRVPALWNIASLFGLRSGFVGWLASYPAEATEGFMVSDRLAYHMFDPTWFTAETDSTTEGITYPAALLEEIEDLLVKPQDVTDEVATYVRGPVGNLKDQFDPDDPVSGLRLAISGCRTYDSVTRRLYASRRPELFGVYFEFTDSVCHLFMKYMAPAMRGASPEDAARYGNGVAATYREADRILGEVLDAVDDSTVVIVVSDHGFKSGDTRPASESRIGHGQAIDWHRIDGAIALLGPAVKRGYRIPDAGILDVAPTLLYLLGLPVDRKMTGRVLLDALDPAWTEGRPVRYTAVYDSLFSASATGGASSPVDQALKDKLVSLGYVAGGKAPLVNMANFYQKNGKFAEAIEVWRKLLEADPGDLGARTGLSNAYFEIGEVDSALAGLGYVLKADPHNLEALRSLSTVYVRQGNGRDALRVAEDVLRVNQNDGGAHFNRGLALDLLGRTEEAADEYRRAVQLAPDLAEAYANLAQIYIVTGLKAEALEAARKAVDLASGKPEMHYVLGQALNLSGNPDEAMVHFTTSIRLNPKFPGGYIGAAGVLLAQGRADSALAVLGSVLREDPGNLEALKSLATVHVRQGSGRDALKAAEDALRIAPDDGGSHYNRGLALELLGRREEAAAEYRSAVRLAPNLAEAYANLAQIYVDTGLKAEAVAAATKAVDLASDNPEMRYVLGRALEISGRPDEAMEHYVASIRLKPDFAGGYIGAAGVLLAQGKADSALALCGKALEATSAYRQYVHNLMGSAYLARRDARGAERQFKLALEADPKFLLARVNLARVYLGQGKQGDARRELEAVLAADPSNQEAGSLLRRLGR